MPAVPKLSDKLHHHLTTHTEFQSSQMIASNHSAAFPSRSSCKIILRAYAAVVHDSQQGQG